MPSIAKAFVTHGDESPAYWQIGNLWQVMATGVQTDNSFTLLDQIVHSGGGGGPITHTHTQDEGLYVISGHLTFNAGGHQGLQGPPGTLVAVPGNTEHSFTVDEADTHVLNFYLPAGFEQLLIGISHPATERVPPPAELVQEMLPPRWLSGKLARDYGQDNVLGDPFADPPNPDLMYTRATPGATVFPFTANASDSDVPAYWYRNGLWTVLASGQQTGNSYSLVEQWLGKGQVYAPHLFQDRDVVYYVLSGDFTFLLNDRLEKASTGATVFIPRGTVHAATVDSAEARCLNLHTPGGFEEYVATVGVKAEKRELPSTPIVEDQADRGRNMRLKQKLGMRDVAIMSPF